jgi:hypothetical protein
VFPCLAEQVRRVASCSLLSIFTQSVLISACTGVIDARQVAQAIIHGSLTSIIAKCEVQNANIHRLVEAPNLEGFFFFEKPSGILETEAHSPVSSSYMKPFQKKFSIHNLFKKKSIHTFLPGKNLGKKSGLLSGLKSTLVPLKFSLAHLPWQAGVGLSQTGVGIFRPKNTPWAGSGIPPASIISASLSLFTLCLFPPLLPGRDFAAGRDGVRRRHAGVHPLDAGPPRALADHQPRSVTLSATTSSSSSDRLS